jgi:hypothetical protein
MENENTVPETISPEAAEAAAFEKANQEALDRYNNTNPADLAAQFFQMLYPEFRRRVSGLSNKDARRLALALVQYPLEDNDPHFHSSDAKQAFSLGLQLIDAKLIMRETVHMEERAEAGLDQLVPEEKNNEITE